MRRQARQHDHTIALSTLRERIARLRPEKLRAIETAIHFALGLMD